MSDETPKGDESGSALRAQLEAALAERNAARDLLVTKVTDGTLVKPEDLREVPVDQLATKAAEIETTKRAERDEILRSELQSRGLTEDQVEQMLGAKAPVVTPPVNEYEEQLRRLASVGSLHGTPPGPQQPQVFGFDRIRLGTEAPPPK